ncbi:hypothetical protein CPC08DRAFT_723957 [Agrocybe pediades]|nr:hypothetical protein CPC08DRAFT_723957 [Agrocybe pediades]
MTSKVTLKKNIMDAPIEDIVRMSNEEATNGSYTKKNMGEWVLIEEYRHFLADTVFTSVHAPKPRYTPRLTVKQIGLASNDEILCCLKLTADDELRRFRLWSGMSEKEAANPAYTKENALEWASVEKFRDYLTDLADVDIICAKPRPQVKRTPPTFRELVERKKMEKVEGLRKAKTTVRRRKVQKPDDKANQVKKKVEVIDLTADSPVKAARQAKLKDRPLVYLGVIDVTSSEDEGTA